MYANDAATVNCNSNWRTVVTIGWMKEEEEEELTWRGIIDDEGMGRWEAIVIYLFINFFIRIPYTTKNS